jgi:hypothetical protein
MDASVRLALIDRVKIDLRDAAQFQNDGNFEKVQSTLENAKAILQSLEQKKENPPPTLVKKVADALRSVEEALQSKKIKKCSYRALNPNEIEKLKGNGIDPEDEKGYDPKKDLFKCQGSGKVAVGWKPWHQDDDGEWQPGGDSFDDTCHNIDKMPWPKKGKGKKYTMDETRIEFRIGGLKKSIDEILENLPIEPNRVHRKGEKQGSTILAHKQDWFVYSAGDTKKEGFEKSMTALVDKLHSVRQKIQKACGKHEIRLCCILYFAANHRPIVSFSPKALKKLSELDAEIDVSIYPLPSVAEE